MKRAFLILLSMVMILSLAACGSSGGQSAGTPPAQQPAESQQPASPEPEEYPAAEPRPSGGKTLVAYYSAIGHTAAAALPELPPPFRAWSRTQSCWTA